MPKRYRDTEIWGKEWYVSLSCPERNAVDYILCRCDSVGVWPPAFSVAERLIGESVNWEELPGKTNGNIVVLPNGKWFVTDFVEFQYGKLRESCIPHRSYVALLEKHGLADRVTEGLGKPSQRLKEKELEKEKEKEKEKEDCAPGVLLTASEQNKLVTKYGADNTKAAYAKLSAYKLQSGRKYASDYGAILHWVMDEVCKKAKGEGSRTPAAMWVCKACGHENRHTGSMCLKCKEARE